MKSKWIFYSVMLILAIPQLTYRFKHPEKTKTQLFVDFFKVYKEFLP